MSSYTDPKKEGRFSWINNFAFRGSTQSTNDETELPVLAPREQRSSSISTIQLGENGNDRRVSGATQYLPQIHTNRSSPQNSIQSLQRELSFRESSENSRDSSPKASGSRYMKPDTVINVQPESISPSYQFDNSSETSSLNATFYCSPLGEPSVIHGVMMSGVLLGAPVLQRFQEESAPIKPIPDGEHSRSDGDSASVSSSQSPGLQKKTGHIMIEMPLDDECDDQIIGESGTESNEQSVGESDEQFTNGGSANVSGYIPANVGAILGGVLLGAVGLAENEQRDEAGDGKQDDDAGSKYGAEEEVEEKESDRDNGSVDKDGHAECSNNKKANCGKEEVNSWKADEHKESENIMMVQNGDDSSQGATNRRQEESEQAASSNAQPSEIDPQNNASRYAGPIAIQERVLEGPAQSVKSYYDMMYYSGVSAYKPMEKTHFKNWISWILYFLHKVFFCYVVFTSSLQSICLLKGGVLYFASENGDKRYNSLVDIGYHLASLFIKICLTYLMSFKMEKTNHMIGTMMEYQEKCHINSRKGASSEAYSWIWKLVVLLAVITIALAGVRTCFQSGANSSKQLVLQSSVEFSRDLFIWSPRNLSQAVDDLKTRYGTNLTTTTIAFGTIVILRDASSYLQIGMAFDVVVIACVVLYVFVRGFMRELKEVIPNVPRENVEAWTRLQIKREKLWIKFRMLQAVSGALNDVYDPLLKLQHVGNLLMYAFFMIMIITQQSAWPALLLYAVNLFKAEIGYLIAGTISEANEGIRDWIRNWAWETGKIHVGDKEIDAAMVLDELDRHPLGLGKGKFLIHRTFHYKFCGLVGSVFFSMADEEKN